MFLDRALAAGLLAAALVPAHADPGAATSFVEADGVRHAHRVLGPAGGRPLVLSQRFRGTMDDWDPAFLEPLAAERAVVVFDAAGVSSSGGETPAMIEAMADDMAAFMRALGHEEVDALGWSMGGWSSSPSRSATPSSWSA